MEESFTKPRRNRSMDEDNAPQGMCAARETALGVLLGMAKECRERAHALEKLADQLSLERLSPEADQALWEILISARRR